MASLDVGKIRGLAESADIRAQGFHLAYQAERRDQVKRAALLNDFFYWSGYKNAYMGIVAQLELAGIIEDELDGEPTCP